MDFDIAWDRQTLTIALLFVLIVVVAVVAVEVYRLNQAIGPVANSSLVRTLSSI